ncbi:hypothetical protein D3C81_1542010 [compost metagenome]
MDRYGLYASLLHHYYYSVLSAVPAHAVVPAKGPSARCLGPGHWACAAVGIRPAQQIYDEPRVLAAVQGQPCDHLFLLFPAGSGNCRLLRVSQKVAYPFPRGLEIR